MSENLRVFLLTLYSNTMQYQMWQANAQQVGHFVNRYNHA